jgi:hypothetical protein
VKLGRLVVFFVFCMASLAVAQTQEYSSSKPNAKQATTAATAATPAPQSEEPSTEDDAAKTVKDAAQIAADEQKKEPAADQGYMINQVDSYGMPAERYQIREMGGAGSLRDHIGIANVGGIKLTAVEFYQIYDRFSNSDESTTSRATSLRASLMYDKNFRRSRIDFQYQPQFGFVNGKYQDDLSQQNVSFDTYRYISQRWTLGVSSQFAYFNTRDLTSMLPLSVDTVTGNTKQQAFLESPSKQMSAESTFSLTYEIDSRNRISIQPNVNYYTYSKSAETAGNSSITYGSTFKWTHVLDRRKSIGAYYSFSSHTYQTGLESSLYNSFGVNYGQVLSPNWSYGVMFGGSRASGGELPQWTTVYSGSLSRRFRKSTASVSYSRDYMYAGYIDNSYHQSISGLYSTTLTPKLTSVFGFGYYRNADTSNPITGKYGTAQFSYKLFPHISCFVNYAYKTQNGDGVLILPGTRNFVSAGFRWAPGVKGSHE